MSTRTVNLEAYHVTFARQGKGVVADFYGETPKRNRVHVKAKFNFTCLPYFMPGLQKEWTQAKAIQENEIKQIDRALGL